MTPNTPRRVTRAPQTLTLDTGACYFALLQGLPRRPSTEQLRFAFEPLLPQPLDDVETRFAPVRDGAHLAVGIDRDRLRELITKQEVAGTTVRSARPAALPPWIEPAQAELGAALARIDFRTGAFEPPSKRRARQRRTALVGLSVVCMFIALLAGNLMRANAASTHEDQARAATAELAHNELGRSTSGLDPLQRLRAERIALQRTRSGPSGTDEASAPDRAHTFALLLAAWPDGLAAETDHLHIDRRSVQIRSAVRTPTDHERLALALSGFAPGWTLASSSVVQSADAYRSVIALAYTPSDETQASGARP